MKPWSGQCILQRPGDIHSRVKPLFLYIERWSVLMYRCSFGCRCGWIRTWGVVRSLVKAAALPENIGRQLVPPNGRGVSVKWRVVMYPCDFWGSFVNIDSRKVMWVPRICAAFCHYHCIFRLRIAGFWGCKWFFIYFNLSLSFHWI